jgi:hypothetical protein
LIARQIHARTDAADCINRILSQLGFDIEFELFTGSAAAYQQFIRQNIRENTIFVLTEDNFITMPENNFAFIQELLGDGLLGDFHEAGMRAAPGYTAHALIEAFNNPGQMHIMPTSFIRNHPHVPAVLVREDIAAEYGQEIRTAPEYIELLEWLKRRNPSSVPGSTITVFPFIPGFHQYVAFDLFMPELGYWSTEWPLYAAKIGTDEFTPTYALPESREALAGFMRLRRDELLHVNVFGGDTQLYSAFPTALMYFYDFIVEPFTGHYQFSGLSLFDASGYRIYALYGGTVPVMEFSWNAYRTSAWTIAGHNAEAGEFLRLLEWLDWEDNYRQLLHGIEVTDPQAVRANLHFLERSEHRPLPLTAPNNYEAEMRLLTPAYTITLTPEGALPLFQMSQSMGEADFRDLQGAYESFANLNQQLLRGNAVLNVDTMNSVIDSFIQRQERENDPILRRFVQAYREAYANAPRR